MITIHHISEPLYSHFIHPSNSNSNRGEDKVLAGGARRAASYMAFKGAGITAPTLHLPLGLRSTSWEPLVEVMHTLRE